jgi:hypothetical protein
MFRYRRQLHRWATRVLLLWCFGIGAGFANACVGEHWAAGEHGARPVATSQGPDPAIAAVAGHHGSHHGEVAGHDDAPLKTNCQDFCEKSTISIPPLKLALDHAGAGALPPPPAEMLCTVALREPRQWGVPRRDGGLAPPITIALLRLTL